MIPDILYHVEEALKSAKEATPSREMSLVITKLEEALHWYYANEKAKTKKA